MFRNLNLSSVFRLGDEHISLRTAARQEDQYQFICTRQRPSAPKSQPSERVPNLELTTRNPNLRSVSNKEIDRETARVACCSF